MKAPEGSIQIILIPALPSSGGFEILVTAVDVVSRFFLAYPTSSQDGKTNAKVTINIMTKDAYLPTTIISHKGSVFMSQVIKEVAEVLGITLQHATTKSECSNERMSLPRKH